MSAEELRQYMGRMDLDHFHREQLSAVEAILTEALHALLKFEDQELEFSVAENGWTEVRNRLIYFELLFPQEVLQGLINQQPDDRYRSLADRLGETWSRLSCWGPGRAGTKKEFENDESQHLRVTIDNLASFFTKWRLFFGRLRVVLTPNAPSTFFLSHLPYRHEKQQMMPTVEPGVSAPAPMGRNDDRKVMEWSSGQLVSPTEVDVPSELFQPDGFFGVSGFRFRGVPVDIGAAPLRRKVLAALWDEVRRCPRPARERRAVIDEVWGTLDAVNVSSNTFNRHVSDIRGIFEDGGLLLRIDNENDRVELVPTPT